MSTITLVAGAVVAFATGTGLQAQSAGAETETTRLIGDCNEILASANPKRRSIRACETLASDGRLSLVEPAAATAYRDYLDERLLACERRQSSPRGQSRGQSSCEP